MRREPLCSGCAERIKKQSHPLIISGSVRLPIVFTKRSYRGVDELFFVGSLVQPGRFRWHSGCCFIRLWCDCRFGSHGTTGGVVNGSTELLTATTVFAAMPTTGTAVTGVIHAGIGRRRQHACPWLPGWYRLVVETKLGGVGWHINLWVISRPDRSGLTHVLIGVIPLVLDGSALNPLCGRRTPAMPG